MNQILVTEKLYVTPELKRKKKFYRLEFFLSVFIVCLLFSYYIYAEYDKNKSEEVSKDILAGVNFNAEEDDTVIQDNGAMVFVLNEDANQNGSTSSEEASKKPSKEVFTTKAGTQYTTEAVINIPKIEVNYPVLSDTSDELLKIAPNKFWGPEPNQVGNYCIVGHNYRNKRFFSKVPTLENGDIIEITDGNGKTVKYSVYSKYSVDPEDTSCTSQLTKGKREVTLITCTDDSKLRVIVKATEVL